jgi:ABC-type glycerol-3-phosphate transport system permease component
MARSHALEGWIVLLVHVFIIAGAGFAFSRFRIRIESLFWLILAAVAWTSVVVVFVLATRADRIVELVEEISKRNS